MVKLRKSSVVSLVSWDFGIELFQPVSAPLDDMLRICVVFCVVLSIESAVGVTWKVSLTYDVILLRINFTKLESRLNLPKKESNAALLAQN